LRLQGSCPGEIFQVFDNGVLIGTTSAPGATTCTYGGSTANPDQAINDPVYSSGWGILGPGSHSITIVVASTAGYPEGGGFLRIDATSGGGKGQGVSTQSVGYRYLQVKKFH
jgi:hypothetical protein